MTTTFNVSQMIVDAANQQGVPPALALAIAQRETGMMQWRLNGSLVTGTAGEVGIFQLEPETASALGVDAADITQNIEGGVEYLGQQLNTFGDWWLAAAAYNDGPGNVQKYLAKTRPLPPSTIDYANAVTAMAQGLAAANGEAVPQSAVSSANTQPSADVTLSWPPPSSGNATGAAAPDNAGSGSGSDANVIVPSDGGPTVPAFDSSSYPPSDLPTISPWKIVAGVAAFLAVVAYWWEE